MADRRDYPLYRTYLEKHELDWLSRSTRAVRWTLPAGIALGVPLVASVGIGALVGVEVASILATYVAMASTTVAAVTGPKWARRVLTRHVTRIARGQADLSRLRSRADGDIVHVHGRVVATETMPSFFGGDAAVFRRVRFALGSRFYFFHEAAVDFDVVDATGERLPVQVAGARLVAAEIPWQPLLPEDHRALVETIPEDISRSVTRAKERFLRSPRGDRLGNEWLLRPGDEIDVVGEKSRAPDFTQSERMHRELPTRAVLRGGRALPLVISPVA